jgi:hypothetical protein
MGEARLAYSGAGLFSFQDKIFYPLEPYFRNRRNGRRAASQNQERRSSAPSLQSSCSIKVRHAEEAAHRFSPGRSKKAESNAA